MPDRPDSLQNSGHSDGGPEVQGEPCEQVIEPSVGSQIASAEESAPLDIDERHKAVATPAMPLPPGPVAPVAKVMPIGDGNRLVPEHKDEQETQIAGHDVEDRGTSPQGQIRGRRTEEMQSRQADADPPNGLSAEDASSTVEEASQACDSQPISLGLAHDLSNNAKKQGSGTLQNATGRTGEQIPRSDYHLTKPI